MTTHTQRYNMDEQWEAAVIKLASIEARLAVVAWTIAGIDPERDHWGLMAECEKRAAIQQERQEFLKTDTHAYSVWESWKRQAKRGA